jgi:hypothetical protein
MVLRPYLRALPGDQDLLTPSLDGQESAKLTPTTRRQDHTLSSSAGHARSSRAARRPLHPEPNVRDENERPSQEGRDRGIVKVIWVFCKSEYIISDT